MLAASAPVATATSTASLPRVLMSRPRKLVRLRAGPDLGAWPGMLASPVRAHAVPSCRIACRIIPGEAQHHRQLFCGNSRLVGVPSSAPGDLGGVVQRHDTIIELARWSRVVCCITSSGSVAAVAKRAQHGARERVPRVRYKRVEQQVKRARLA